ARHNMGLNLWQVSARDKSLEAQGLELLARLGLESVARARAGTLSHGDKRRVELAIVLTTEPKLVLLDEPTAGMTPEETHAVVQLIRSLADSGPHTFFLTEHDMDVVFGLAQEIFVMHRGELLAEGTPEEIRNDPNVRTAYLGEEMH
ncbi:MAG: ATP-binding cassette domain-containing protein, partial [Candidatus Methylomirabilales bacterium]